MLLRARTTLGTAGRRARHLAQADNRRVERAVRRGLVLPRVARGPRRRGEVWAVTMVKNEVDILGGVLDHLLRQGVDRILVSDNGSTDGTLELVRERSRVEPVLVALDHEVAYHQAAKMTRLARFAARCGADWVVPFDADELWFAEGELLAPWLRRQEADVVEAELHNIFPTASGGLALDAAVPIHGKVAFRAHRLAALTQGNHTVDRPGRRLSGERLYIAHLPWRSLEQFTRKVRQGAQAYAGVAAESNVGEHWRTLGRAEDAGLRARWEALLRGEHDPSMHWTPAGPLRPVTDWPWTTWDPASPTRSDALAQRATTGLARRRSVTDVRADLGQLSWCVREYRDLDRVRRLVRSVRGIELPRLRPRPRVPGSVWAVSMVRNEADVVGLVVEHLFAQGVDEVLVADNMSTDGTFELLLERSRANPRLHVVRDHEPAFYQSEKITHLMRVAWWRGADWVIPFDGDEFWFADGVTVADYLRRTTVDTVYATFHHMVPTQAHPADLRTATFVLDSTPAFPSKVAIRSHPLAIIIPGNHETYRVGARGSGLHVAHAIYRGPEQLIRKVRQGVAAFALTDQQEFVGGHWAAAAALDEDVVQEVWQNISAGRPDARVEYAAAGPMVRVTPLSWPVWDPDSVTGVGSFAGDGS